MRGDMGQMLGTLGCSNALKVSNESVSQLVYIRTKHEESM